MAAVSCEATATATAAAAAVRGDDERPTAQRATYRVDDELRQVHDAVPVRGDHDRRVRDSDRAERQSEPVAVAAVGEGGTYMLKTVVIMYSTS